MHRFALPSALALLVALLPATALAVPSAAAASAANAESTSGAQVFRDHCAGCHEGQQPGAPAKQFLQMMSASAVVGALTSGMMTEEGRSLSTKEKEQVAAYLTGGS
ncbi:MAG: c-type cytochrome, partial [Steroidobacteraceae bacterium]